MNISRFFIERPIFAAVIAVFITLIGAFAYPQLLAVAISRDRAADDQRPAPRIPARRPRRWPRPSPTPLEQEINGVEGMLYMTSSSTRRGWRKITVTFKPGTDLDAAQVLVQNRVALAEPRLPEQVRQVGVTVNKQSTRLPDDRRFDLDRSRRSTSIMSAITPIRTCATGCCGSRASAASRCSAAAIIRCGSGSIPTARPRATSPPARSSPRCAARTSRSRAARSASRPMAAAIPRSSCRSQVQGRLTDPAQFADVVIKTDADAARSRGCATSAGSSSAARNMAFAASFGGKRGVALAVIQQPGSNALDAARLVLDEVEAAKKDFPPGIVLFDPLQSDRICRRVGRERFRKPCSKRSSWSCIVIIVFLQTWRAAIIPIIAIPVALVGTFAVQLALGFSINSLSLFALVLAVGIVVDDAIVVVEAVEKHIRDGMTPREAAHRTMQRGLGRADRHRPGADRGVRPDRVRPRHPGHLLPPVRGDDRRGLADLADRLADAVAGPGRNAAQAAPAEQTLDHGPRLLRPVRVGAAQVQRRLRLAVGPLRAVHRAAWFAGRRSCSSSTPGCSRSPAGG